KINATCTHHRRRRRFIASGQEHDTIQGICPNGFLDVHAGQIAKEHRGGSHDRLAKRGYRELKRETSGFSYTTLDKFSKVAQVTITRCELRPGITNANDGFATKVVVRVSLVAQPGTVYKSHLVRLSKPVVTPEFLFHPAVGLNRRYS